MKIAELIVLLQELNPEWEICGTASGSLQVLEPPWWEPGSKFGFVFMDGRPTKLSTVRKKYGDAK